MLDKKEPPKPGDCMGRYSPESEDCTKKCTISVRCREETIKLKKLEIEESEKDTINTFLHELDLGLELEDVKEKGTVHTYKYELNGVRVCVVKISIETGRVQISSAASGTDVYDSFSSDDIAKRVAETTIDRIKQWVDMNVTVFDENV